MCRLLLVVVIALTVLTGCFEDENYPQAERMGQAGSSGGYAESALFAADVPPPAAIGARRMSAKMARPSSLALDRSQFEGRRIAETHAMSIQTQADDLYGRYQRDMQQCITLGCEITYSKVNSGGTASLNARLTPKNLPVFLDFVGEGKGEILSHQVSTDDRTFDYVDTEAKLKNQRVLRDRLLKLLDSDKPYKVRDLLEVERELTRVQSQIDSLTATRRSIEQVTARATVKISYRIPPKAIDIAYHDVSNSLRYAWNGLLRSVSDVISFVLKVIPWIPVWFVGAWLAFAVIRFAWRKSGASCGGVKRWVFWSKEKSE